MPSGRRTPRSRVVSRSAIRTSLRCAPSMASMAVRRRCKSFTTPVPIVPKPISPARISGTDAVARARADFGTLEAEAERPHRGHELPVGATAEEGVMIAAVGPERDLEQRDLVVLVLVERED